MADSKLVTLAGYARTLAPGRRLARAIREAGLTQHSAGALVGVDARQVRRWLTDEAKRADRLALFFALAAHERHAPQLAPLRACTDSPSEKRQCSVARGVTLQGEAAVGVAEFAKREAA